MLEIIDIAVQNNFKFNIGKFFMLYGPIAISSTHVPWDLQVSMPHQIKLISTHTINAYLCRKLGIWQEYWVNNLSSAMSYSMKPKPTNCVFGIRTLCLCWLLITPDSAQYGLQKLRGIWNLDLTFKCKKENIHILTTKTFWDLCADTINKCIKANEISCNVLMMECMFASVALKKVALYHSNRFMDMYLWYEGSSMCTPRPSKPYYWIYPTARFD